MLCNVSFPFFLQWLLEIRVFIGYRGSMHAESGSKVERSFNNDIVLFVWSECIKVEKNCFQLTWCNVRGPQQIPLSKIDICNIVVTAQSWCKDSVMSVISVLYWHTWEVCVNNRPGLRGAVWVLPLRMANYDPVATVSWTCGTCDLMEVKLILIVMKHVLNTFGFWHQRIACVTTS